MKAAFVACVVALLASVAQAQVLQASIVTANIVIQNRTPLAVATTGSAVEITILEGRKHVGVQVTNVWTGELRAFCTIIGTVWVELVAVGPINTNGIYLVQASGCVKVRMSASAPITGTATVSLVSTD